ncbi:MAG: hypothetical protein IH987_18620 [Planctomycetes bacterium]|nr:hypothetical protein [Planctomycetota bacterium]
MNPHLSSELEQAVIAHAEGALKVQGASGTYWILTDSAMEIRAKVEKGLEQADRGEIAPWDSEEIKREGRRLKDERSKDA